ARGGKRQDERGDCFPRHGFPPHQSSRYTSMESRVSSVEGECRGASAEGNELILSGAAGASLILLVKGGGPSYLRTSATSRKLLTGRSGGYGQSPNGRWRGSTKAARMPKALAPTQSKA